MPLPSLQVIIESAIGLPAAIDLNREIFVGIGPPPTTLPGTPPPLWALLPTSNFAQLIQQLGAKASGEKITLPGPNGTELRMVNRGGWGLIFEEGQLALAQPLPNSTGRSPNWDAWQRRDDCQLIVSKKACVAIQDYLLRLRDLTDVELNGLFAEDDADDGEVEGAQVHPVQSLLQLVLGSGRDYLGFQDDRLSPFLQQYQSSLALISEIEEAGIGIRFRTDESPLRLSFAIESNLSNVSEGLGGTELLERLPGGEFILAAGGKVPPHWLEKLVEPMVRDQLRELQSYGGEVYPKENVDRVVVAARQVVQGIREVALHHMPYDEKEGIFSNRFILLRSADSAALVRAIDEFFVQWNWLMDHADSEVCLQFQKVPINVGQKNGTEFQADMKVSIGVDESPELVKLMEEMFGPEGKLRCGVIPLDEKTVLIANARPQRTVAWLQRYLDPQLERLADSRGIAQLTGAVEGPFACFLSLHEYTKWLQAERHAGLGEIIGGPLVEIFPPSLPVVMSIGGKGSTLELQATLSDDLLQHVIAYLRK